VLQIPVLIVGAGPVGLTLALDLGTRGVRCLLVEKNETSIQLPKMERCNARTMEIYRRLGVAERIRDAGLPREAPMDVFLADSMASDAIVHLPYPSVADAKKEIATHNDGRPLEPYQLISQYTLEPLLRSFLAEKPGVDVRFGCELVAFRQDDDGVTATLRTTNGVEEEVRAAYLVGCDGGASTVRKQLGIKLSGEGSIRRMRQALYHVPGLYERIPMGRGRHYHITQPFFPFIILQDSTKHWTMHCQAESDAEMLTIFRRALGELDAEVDVEMLSVNEWTQHLLCADRYRDGRVFIAGDAAHLVIPTGGLGMNTGVGDATDLAWKLAGTLAGWGGPGLLDAYETERRQIGLRNVRASGSAMRGRFEGWRKADTREEMGRRFDVEQRKVTEILGIEAGYRYVDSPLVWSEAGEGPDPDSLQYVPTTWPGTRLPHVWLEDGSALQDRIGYGYTLLRLGGTRADTSAIEGALRATGAPLYVLDVPDARARELYGYDLLLVRPDLHVVWRGNAAPPDAERLAAIATGRARTPAAALSPSSS
jgi:2-polyprenyl-6-methoxyphenol hydroxylase-like FAD-dependent oxidoreductase